MGSNYTLQPVWWNGVSFIFHKTVAYNFRPSKENFLSCVSVSKDQTFLCFTSLCIRGIHHPFLQASHCRYWWWTTRSIVATSMISDCFFIYCFLLISNLHPCKYVYFYGYMLMFLMLRRYIWQFKRDIANYKNLSHNLVIQWSN